MTNFAAPSQPTFGRRGQPRAAPPSRAGGFVAPDLRAAQEALRTGKPPAWARHTLGGIAFGLACLVALLVLMVGLYGPGLMRDLRLAGSWVPATDLRAEEGQCTNYQFVWTDCSVDIVSPGADGEQRETLRYMMSFTRGGGELLIPMRSTRDPAAVAVGYAAETELTNRTISFALYGVLLVVGLFAGARRLARGEYKGGRAHRALAAGLAEIAGSAS